MKKGSEKVLVVRKVFNFLFLSQLHLQLKICSFSVKKKVRNYFRLTLWQFYNYQGAIVVGIHTTHHSMVCIFNNLYDTFEDKTFIFYIHIWLLRSFSPRVSHITYVGFVNFVYGWRDPQFKVDFEHHIFEKLLIAILFYS